MSSIFAKVRKLLTVLALIVLFTHLDQALIALASSTLPISGIGGGFEQLPSPPSTGSGQSIIDLLVSNGLAYLKAVVIVVAIVFITIMGFQLVLARGNEEDISKAKRGLTYSLVALLMISMSEDIGRIFDQRDTTILAGPGEILRRKQLFDSQVEIFVIFIKTLISAFAWIMIVRSGLKLVTAGGNEDQVGTHRKSLLYSVGGLLLIYIGDIFINRVFYKIDESAYNGLTGVQPAIDAKAGVEEIVGITNLIVTFMAPVAVLMLIIGAVMYATAAGNEENMERAKRLVFATIIGIVIIFGAFAIVSTVINSKLSAVGAIAVT